MKKKLIGLSTLLLVLLLGLSTTSYASMEIEEIQNFIYNRAIAQNYNIDTLENWFNNSTVWSNFQSQSTTYLTNNYDQLLLSSGYNIYFLWRVKESNLLVNIRNINSNPTSYNITTNGFKGFHFRFNDDTFYKNNYISTTFNSIEYAYSTADWYYSNLVYFSGPFGLPNDSIIDGPYQSTQFTYVYNPNLQNVTVQDLLAEDVQMKAISYSDIYYDNDYLCIAGDFDQLDHVYLAYYKYNRYSGQWEPYQWDSPYTNYEKEDNQIRLYFNGNYVANTIICLGFIPKTDDFYAQCAWFYLTGKNTSTSSGIVVPSSYSGDNDVQQQINDNNLQEIKDTLTDDSEVDNMLAEFGSGDINTMASKFGLPSIPNPFSQFIETIFYGITDVLTLDGDVALDFGFQGQHMYLKSSDFTTPLNVVTVFLSSFLTFIYVYYMIELGYRTLINIREFNLDKTGIGNHYGQAGDGLQADGSWRLL